MYSATPVGLRIESTAEGYKRGLNYCEACVIVAEDNQQTEMVLQVVHTSKYFTSCIMS